MSRLYDDIHNPRVRDLVNTPAVSEPATTAQADESITNAPLARLRAAVARTDLDHDLASLVALRNEVIAFLTEAGA